MTTTLYLARHGETDWNLEQRFHGSTDLSMNARGLEQVRALARRFEKKRIDAVYASSLVRARVTAELVIGSRELTVGVEPGLAELDFGAWEGLFHEDLVAREGARYFEWLADPITLSPPGGETVAEMARRVRAAVERIVDRHPDGRVLVASHAGPIRVILSDVLEADLGNFLRIGLDPAGLSIVTYFGDASVIRLMNDTTHWREG